MPRTEEKPANITIAISTKNHYLKLYFTRLPRQSSITLTRAWSYFMLGRRSYVSHARIYSVHMHAHIHVVQWRS